MNSSGYPCEDLQETLQALRFCRHLLQARKNSFDSYVRLDKEEDEEEEELIFYLNDFRVLLEIILRELRDIPCSHENVMLRLK